MTFLLDFIIAFTVSAVLIPIVLRVARKRKLFDPLDERKIHTESIPRLGGIGIFWGFVAAVVATVFLARTRHGSTFPALGFWAFLAAAVGVHALGLFDDLKNLSGRKKLMVQTIMALVPVLAGFYFREFGLPGFTGSVKLSWGGPLVTVFWIVGITNAINLLDGMDGMAGGISFIGFGMWAAYYLKDGQYLPTLVAVAGAGATLGFLFYNFPPANIFMGDSGSLLLGYVLALLPLIGDPAKQSSMSAVAAVTICLLPILDTMAAILRRWRRKVSFFTPDRYHLHHKLLNLGFSNRQVLAYIYAVCASLGATVLVSVYVDPKMGTALMVGSWFLGIAIFVVLHYLKERNMTLGSPESAGKDAL